MCRRLAPARLGKDMSAHLPAPRAVPCQSGSLAMHLCSSCCPLLMHRTQAEPQRQAHACAPPSISCSARPTLDCLLCSSAAAAATASARSCSRSSAVSQGCAATSLRCTCSVTSAGRSSCSNIELALLQAGELRVELRLQRFQLEMQELHLSCPPGVAVQLHGCIHQATAAPAESMGHVAESTPRAGCAAMWVAW